MPRYTIGGVEAAVDPVDATSAADIALTAAAAASGDASADLVLQIQNDAKKKQLADAKPPVNQQPPVRAETSNAKLYFVGAALVGGVAWLYMKDKKKKA